MATTRAARKASRRSGTVWLAGSTAEWWRANLADGIGADDDVPISSFRTGARIFNTADAAI
jgi:hypothetical protein